MAGLSCKMSYDHIFKYVIIGDRGVGKSCLALQFTDNIFQAAHKITVGMEFDKRTINVGSKTIKLHIWDMSSDETFRYIAKLYYSWAACLLLVYDVTRRETFTHVATWLKENREHASANVTVVLIGNKCDLSDRRLVTYEEGQQFAIEHELLFIETSAKTAENVDKVMDCRLSAITCFSPPIFSSIVMCSRLSLGLLQ